MSSLELSVEHTFESGLTLPVRLGYETYGVLNSDQSNAILLCHYYTGTSRVAGSFEDGSVGWWDALIGPGKPIDTQRFFVVCMNVLSNVQVGDSSVISTGPETQAEDGLPYGDRFPRVSLRDNARLQHELMETLGISSWYAVIGPSYGGIQALMWGVLYPEATPRLGAIACSPHSSVALQSTFYPLLQAVSQGENGTIEALRLIGFCGLGASGLEHVFFGQSFEAYLRVRARFAQLSHILSIGQTVSQYTVFETVERHELLETWRRLGVRLLSVNIRGDQFFPEKIMGNLAQETQSLGISHEHIEIDSEVGHLACIQETHRFADAIDRLLM